jgi:hypothetical protein
LGGNNKNKNTGDKNVGRANAAAAEMQQLVYTGNQKRAPEGAPMEEISAVLQLFPNLKGDKKNEQENLKGNVENERKKNKEPRPANDAHQLENNEGDRENGSKEAHDVFS